MHHRPSLTPTSTSENKRLTPLQHSLLHAAEAPKRKPIQWEYDRLPDPGPFDITGGFKTAQAADIQSQLTVTYLNINGLSDHKLDFVLAYMLQTRTDVLICTDARLTEKNGRRLEKRVKNILGPFARVHFTALSTGKRTRRNGNCPLVGGFFCVVNSRWGPSLLGLGILTCLPLCTADGVIAIMGTYWPTKYTDDSVGNHPGSF